MQKCTKQGMITAAANSYDTFLFCGDIGVQQINLVEKLSIHANPNLQVQKQWELIPETNLITLPALSYHLSIPSNSNQIIIFGGRDNDDANVYLYHARTDSCQSFKVHGAFNLFNIYTGNYPIAQYGHNKVVALV